MKQSILEKKYALIDCKYFIECYENTDELYLCPWIKQECSEWNFRLLEDKLQELKQK